MQNSDSSLCTGLVGHNKLGKLRDLCDHTDTIHSKGNGKRSMIHFKKDQIGLQY